MKQLLTLLLAVCTIATAAAQSTFTSALKAKAKKGTTIYGTVECDGKPLAGVQVSDGYEIATTDKRGVYNLASAKRNGYVFITIPSGYESPTEGDDVVPQFWANLTADPATAERHDFALRKVDNLRHAIVAVSDIHLANHHNDIGEFRDVFLPSLRKDLEQYRKQNIPVYTLCFGDSSHEIYWYDYLYDIGNFRKTIAELKYPTPFFCTMGNHDNDGAVPHSPTVDFDAAAKYRATFGPTYYSMNIGKVHYVMLDNIYYINTPGGKKAKGIVGSRNYNIDISAEQMDWLAKDLALIEDKTTPIIIGCHSPIFKYKNGRSGAIVSTLPAERESALIDLLKPFEQVHVVAGHTHRNRVTRGCDDKKRPELHNIIDHNIVAVAGSLWYSSGFGGPQIGSLGEPAGCKIFDIDSTNIEWRFKATQHPAEKQFTCFDMNSVREYFATNGEAHVFMSRNPKRTTYSNFEANAIMVNVWDWANDWKISIKENGRELKVTRRKTEHPLMLTCIDIPNALWLTKFSPKDNKPKPHPHMFHAIASSADSTIEVTVTDAFGNVYTETMERPKQFHRFMK